MRDTHDSSFGEGSQGAASEEARRWTGAVCQLSNRPATPSMRLSCDWTVPQRWQVTAALSAAVTITKQQETALNLHGGAS